MGLSGIRTPWIVTLMVAVLALPILGITAYLTYEVQQLVAHDELERSGLEHLTKLETFYTYASQFALARSCPRIGADANALRSRAGNALAAVSAELAKRKPEDWDDFVDSWSRFSAPSAGAAETAMFFDDFDDVFVNVSDASGLTFDTNPVGVSLSDALAYRLPVARTELQSARRLLCSFSDAPTLEQRLTLKKHQTLADKSIADALDDVRDGGPNPVPGADTSWLAQAYGVALRVAPRASGELQTFMTTPQPTNHAATEAALDEATASLATLTRSLVPALDQMLALRLDGYKRDRMIRLIPGIVGLFAALLAAWLMIRLVLEHAALDVANQTAQEQERMAMHDVLTGIMNRRAFFSALERAVTGGTNNGAICVFDVDHFKKVNDTFGHLTGDELLVRLAQIIEVSVRSTDVVARLGGDEFAVFLHPPVDRRSVERVLDRITSDMRLPAEIRGERVNSSVSVGAALIHGESMEEVQEALARADAALYQAKEAHRGGFIFDNAV